MLIQPPAPTMAPTPSPSRVWWLASVVLAILTLVGIAGYWYWNRVSPNTLVKNQESELENVDWVYDSPLEEFQKSDKNVYSLQRFAAENINFPESVLEVRMKLSEMIGSPYLRDEVLVVLDNPDPQSFKTVAQYLVDDNNVYRKPSYGASTDIVNDHAEYVGIIDGIIVLRTRGSVLHPVRIYKNAPSRDLITGTTAVGDFSNTAPAGYPDPNSFTAISISKTGWASYFKDQNHLYKVEGQDHELNILEGVDKDSFEVLNEAVIPCRDICGDDSPPEAIYSYLKDKHQVFFENYMSNTIKIISTADSSTFEVVEGREDYDAQDKNNKYLRGEIVSGQENKVYEEILKAQPYSFYCRLRSGTESNCVLFAKRVEDQDYTALNLVLDYGSAYNNGVLPSPDGKYVLVTLETKALIIDVATLKQSVVQMTEENDRLGTYSEFPSFIPKSSWLDDSRFKLEIYSVSSLGVDGQESKPRDIKIIDLRNLL